jgi:hypothetical protein
MYCIQLWGTSARQIVQQIQITLYVILHAKTGTNTESNVFWYMTPCSHIWQDNKIRCNCRKIFEQPKQPKKPKHVSNFLFFVTFRSMSSITSQTVVKASETFYVESEGGKLELIFSYLRKKLELWRPGVRVADRVSVWQTTGCALKRGCGTNSAVHEPGSVIATQYSPSELTYWHRGQGSSLGGSPKLFTLGY